MTSDNDLQTRLEEAAIAVARRAFLDGDGYTNIVCAWLYALLVAASTAKWRLILSRWPTDPIAGMHVLNNGLEKLGMEGEGTAFRHACNALAYLAARMDPAIKFECLAILLGSREVARKEMKEERFKPGSWRTSAIHEMLSALAAHPTLPLEVFVVALEKYAKPMSQAEEQAAAKKQGLQLCDPLIPSMGPNLRLAT